MNIVAKRRLVQFWQKHPQSEAALSTWYSLVHRARWQGPADVKAMFGTAVDILPDNRLVFDVNGNKYRLVVRVSYEFRAVLIKFVGTHAEYDRIDARTI